MSTEGYRQVSSSRYYKGTGSHFVHPNGYVKLPELERAPTIVHVWLRSCPYTSELQKSLERSLDSPIYLSEFFETPTPEFDIYALATADEVIRALGAHETVVRAEVRRR